MKKRLGALLLCVALLGVMLLQGCSTDGVVVGTVGEDKITVKDVNTYVDYMLFQYSMQQGSLITRADIPDVASLKQMNQSALDMAVTFQIAMQKAEEKKLYPLTAAEQKQIGDSVTQIATYLPQFGLTSADYTKIITLQTTYQLLMTDTTKNVTASDDEVKAEYDKEVAAQKTSYTADATAYDTAMNDGSTVVVYDIGGGYRYVKHILIAMPDTIATQISTAEQSGDTATVASLRATGLPQIKAKADEVLALVKGGGDFDSLIAQYGADPGMKPDQPTGKTGYKIGSPTTIYAQEFKDAAMGLAKVGDTTDLVASDYGYHIIKYVGDVLAGPVPLADVQTALKAQVLQTNKQAMWNTTLAQWKTDLKVVENADKIPAVLPKASAAAKT